MTIYEKLLNARQEIMKKDIKADTPAYNFKYIDMPQVMTLVNTACANAKIIHTTTFENGFATLTVTNVEKPEEKIAFTVPASVDMVHINDKQPIQNLGGLVTYTTRYLLMLAFGISEHDEVEEIASYTSNIKKEEKKAEKKEEKKTPRYSDDEMKERVFLVDALVETDPTIVKSMLAYLKVDSIDDVTTDFLKDVYNKKVLKRTKTGGQA